MPEKSRKQAPAGGPTKGEGGSRKGTQINVRVTAEQKEQLERLAGDDTLSGFVLKRALGGAARHAFTLRTIKELHDVGRALQELAGHPAAHAGEVEAALSAARDQIDRLAATAIAEADPEQDASEVEAS